MKKYGALLVVMIIALMTGSGCYTVLQHSNDEQGFSNQDNNYNEDYGYSQYYYPSYWTLTPRWGHYYAVPWWWDYGYYHDDGTIYNNDEGSPRSSGGEKALPNSGFQEVQPPGAPSITRGPSGSGSSGSSSSGTATKQKPAEQKSDDDSKTVKTKEKQEDSESSKPTREAGRWHK